MTITTALRPLAGSEVARPAGATGNSPHGEDVEVSAIIPCLNEEPTLAICIRKIQRAFARLGVRGEIVVGDNGSTDRSVEIARAYGARVIWQPIRGYGAAITAAAAAARGRYLIMADADDSYDWSDLEPFLDALRRGADLVVGNRFRGGIEQGAMPPLHRYFGNPMLSFVARLFFNVPLGDFHCGMRAFTRDAFERMRLRTTGMEFATEMIVRGSRANLQIVEVPIRLYPDERNRPPHLRSFRDGWRHLRFILAQAPNYTYLVPAALSLTIGFLGVTLLAGGPLRLGGFFMGPHFLALASMLVLVGFNILALGLLAKVIVCLQMPEARDRTVEWLRKTFRLEFGLIAGSALAAGGLVIDSALLYHWLTVPGSMDDTVPAAFLATTSVTLGFNIVFVAFLLTLALEGQTRDDAGGG
jgi:glycosyltransferase involved in cell wall biosynthesis